jgi:hypothetical protein
LAAQKALYQANIGFDALTLENCETLFDPTSATDFPISNTWLFEWLHRSAHSGDATTAGAATSNATTASRALNVAIDAGASTQQSRNRQDHQRQADGRPDGKAQEAHLLPGRHPRHRHRRSACSAFLEPAIARRRRTGNGCQSHSLTDQLGRWITAPLRPHCEQRAQARSLSLDASMPHRIISGATAIGAMWPHPCASQHTHSQALSRCSSASVGAIAWR